MDGINKSRQINNKLDTENVGDIYIYIYINNGSLRDFLYRFRVIIDA